MRTPYVHHVTLTTGHVRRSPRHEVSGEALAECAQAIAAGLESAAVPVPGMPGYLLRVRRFGGGCLTVELRARGRSPLHGDPLLVTIGIATHSRCGAVLWREMHDRDAPDVPPEPWCAARIEPAAASDPGAMTWAGDLERCLAWAWIEHAGAAP